MARKKKKAHHEEHISEAWLIPYADILTLLLALFIVLYASSKVDQKKFEQIAQSFSMAFNSGQPALKLIGPGLASTLIIYAIMLFLGWNVANDFFPKNQKITVRSK